jgi:hypothetical protein
MLFPDVDLAAGTVTLAIWQSVILTGLLLLFLFLAIYRADWRTVIGPAVRLSLALFGIAAAWTLLDRLAERDRADERRALDQRILEMSARALVPGSTLGCFEPSLGEATETACESALFAGPDTIAAATTYVSGSLALLADAVANGWDANYDPALAALRRRLEADRFGLVAQVLAGEGCSAQKCEKLAVFSDPRRVSANLKARTFDTLVARYSGGWSSQPASAATQAAPAATQAAPAAPAVAAAPTPPAPAHPPGPGINFPSAASIPPVSIMTNEPTEPPTQVAPPAAATQKRQPAPGRPASRAQTAPAAQTAPTAPPIQIGPPAATAGTEPSPPQ